MLAFCARLPQYRTPVMNQYRKGKVPLGKITASLRMRPETKAELERRAMARFVTNSDYVEAILRAHFKAVKREEEVA